EGTLEGYPDPLYSLPGFLRRPACTAIRRGSPKEPWKAIQRVWIFPAPWITFSRSFADGSTTCGCFVLCSASLRECPPCSSGATGIALSTCPLLADCSAHSRSQDCS